MKPNKIFFLLTFLLIFSQLNAQNIAMHQWRVHLAYNNTTIIAVSSQKVYAVSDGALFSVTKYDNNIDIYSKIAGLSDNSIFNIAYSQEEGFLLIAYENGNIDLLFNNGSIVNIPDIFRKNIASEKKINNIFFYNGFAYLSCSFGIVKLDVERQEIADSYIIGNNATMLNINSLSVLDGNFYAVTQNNILKAPESGVNLANYANWQLLANVPSGENSKAIVYDSKLYLLKKDNTVHVLQNNIWQTNVYSSINNICANGNALFLLGNTGFRYFIGSNSGTKTVGYYPQMAIFDATGSKIWTAASETGIGMINMANDLLDAFKPEGPITNFVWRMRTSGGKLIAVPGGRWDVQNLRDGNVMMYENGSWSNITNTQILAVLPNVPCRDLIDIAIDPNDNTHFYTASFGNGIFEFRNNWPYKLYNSDNSGIECHTIFNIVGNPEYYNYQRIGSILLDKDNNLWFTNPNTSAFLKVMKQNGATTKFTYASSGDVETPFDIIIDKNKPNLKYVIISRGRGMVFYAIDDRGTVDNIEDDAYVSKTFFLDQDGKRFETDHYMCGVQDPKTGSLWIGTNAGPVILPNPQNVFNPNYLCQRIKIARNDGTNLADYLLENDVISAIAIDGNNRKWFGSETTGVYLMSEDGTDMIHHFTSENSPLLSDNITSIAINEQTGEVFFGTGKGLISFQSDAKPGYKKFTNLHAYPNPVRENYHGLITITGLVENSIVKITDITGNLVYETVSKGGMVTWDGNRAGGKRVSTGVYLAICTVKDGSESAVCKILVIN
jgi:hypothetical protein